MKERDILLMDGDCGLCSHVANFMYPRLANKGSLQFLSNSSKEGRKIISKLSKQYQITDTVYLIRNGKCHIKSGAAVRCLLYMRWHYKIFFPLFWLYPLPLRDIKYSILARYRHYFFKRPAYCIFPD
ncbi:MAG: thiol-disulfide oxidoreductase DCC family protein [Candidatus Poseidoniales archaeon]|jgi:predicted DCC family thiol-disulfide oxidoreductase YuxK|tara:strand:- start:565 stop:945 length:381 start_codon:yes stop_codon:yes gene_type:complete